MYKAKRAGGGICNFYSSEMDWLLMNISKWKLNCVKLFKTKICPVLPTAIEFKRWQKIKRVEALIRWEHPELGLVSPIKIHSSGRRNRSYHAHRRVGNA